MSSGASFRNLTVGLTFLGSLAILGATTLLMSNVSFFSKVEALEVRFPQVDNLQAGDDILLRGVRVGQVDAIRYDPADHPDEPVIVRCVLPESSTAQVPSAAAIWS
jgi:ABC-type transporter Mla subunit MlaD